MKRKVIAALIVVIASLAGIATGSHIAESRGILQGVYSGIYYAVGASMGTLWIVGFIRVGWKR